MKKIILGFIYLTLSLSMAYANAPESNTSTTSVNEIIENASTTSTSTATNVASSTATSTQASTSTQSIVECDQKNKIEERKSRIEKQIKKQISDKNKIVDLMLEVSASSSPEKKEIISDQIIILEESVLDIVKMQKSIVTLLASSSEMACDMKNAATNTKDLIKNKDIEKNNLRIKRFEINIVKKASEINNFIKVSIKETLI
jgi:hypothetical protein